MTENIINIFQLSLIKILNPFESSDKKRKMARPALLPVILLLLLLLLLLLPKQCSPTGVNIKVEGEEQLQTGGNMSQLTRITIFDTA